MGLREESGALGSTRAFANGALSAWRQGRSEGGDRLASFSRCLRFAALSLQASPLSGPHHSGMLLGAAASLMAEWTRRSGGQAIAKIGGPAWTPAMMALSHQREDEALARVVESLSPRWSARKRAAPWALARPGDTARKLYADLACERLKGWMSASCGGKLKERIESDLALASERVKSIASSRKSPHVEEVFTLMELCASQAQYRPQAGLPTLFELAQTCARAQPAVDPADMDARFLALQASMERLEIESSLPEFPESKRAASRKASKRL